ncbi:MAG TPA: histidine kinase [Mycobacteriales bacterium]|nr:histidine kinase [Mycobacteriales bacterium]
MRTRHYQPAIYRKIGRVARMRDVPAPDLAGLAHDLHDVVAHRLTTMVVQADAAQTRLAGRCPETAAALAAIATSGRAGLAELRDLLARLQPDPPPARTGPGPADLAGLLELAGGPGRRPTLEVVGEPRPLPPPVQQTLYRIAQEAVTNALRHAPGATTRLTLRYGDGVVELEVDTGPAEPAAGDGPGRGRPGMLRRVAALGGGLVAGPRPDGGYRVLVTLPHPGPG